MAQGLPEPLVAAVLERLGLPRAPSPDRDGLALLYRAWCRGIPWDNVQKRISVVERRPVLAGAEPEEFFANFLAHRTGGTCWPSSGALHALLRSLGFSARRAVGSMHHRRFGPNVNHGTTIVAVDGEDLLVDSSILNEVPLPLHRGETTAIQSAVHPIRAVPAGELWELLWAPMGRDEEVPCLLLEDDAPGERWSERYERSRVEGFSYTVTLRRNFSEGVLSLGNGRRAFKDANGAIASAAVDDTEVRRLLAEEAGLSPAIVARLPADEPDPRAGRAPRP
ncbi:MAG TPA: arylamine N-acetyltransferase [Candidatus Limnocylindrales bacterium]|nr:arylamine N-acetyltransferase [Candidatus Limnocylindrales bacterium]